MRPEPYLHVSPVLLSILTSDRVASSLTLVFRSKQTTHIRYHTMLNLSQMPQLTCLLQVIRIRLALNRFIDPLKSILNASQISTGR